MSTQVPAVPATAAPVATTQHMSILADIKAGIAWIEKALGVAAKYAPEAGAVADMAEVALGQPELVPVTSEAVGGLEALDAADVAAHAGNITAVLQSVQATVTAAKTIAAGAVAATGSATVVAAP